MSDSILALALADVEHGTQDHVNGRALRLLVEALPDNGPDDDWVVKVTSTRDGSVVAVWNGPGWRNGPEVAKAAVSLAEAADACRAALPVTKP